MRAAMSLFGATALIVANTCFAHDAPVGDADVSAPQNWELTLGPGGVANSDLNAGALGAHAGVGYFLTPSIELSLRETLFYSSFPNGTNWMSLTRGALDYQFNLGRWHPFLGIQAGYGMGIHNTSSTEFGGEVGLKFDLTRDVSLVFMAEYEQFLRHRPFETGIREDTIVLFGGISFRW